MLSRLLGGDRAGLFPLKLSGLLLVCAINAGGRYFVPKPLSPFVADSVRTPLARDWNCNSETLSLSTESEPETKSPIRLGTVKKQNKTTSGRGEKQTNKQTNKQTTATTTKGWGHDCYILALVANYNLLCWNNRLHSDTGGQLYVEITGL